MFRAHEYWELATPPDLVVFGKKTQVGGFYSADGVDPTEVGTIIILECYKYEVAVMRIDLCYPHHMY